MCLFNCCYNNFNDKMRKSIESRIIGTCDVSIERRMYKPSFDTTKGQHSWVAILYVYSNASNQSQSLPFDICCEVNICCFSIIPVELSILGLVNLFVIVFTVSIANIKVTCVCLLLWKRDADLIP